MALCNWIINGAKWLTSLNGGGKEYCAFNTEQLSQCDFSIQHGLEFAGRSHLFMGYLKSSVTITSKFLAPFGAGLGGGGGGGGGAGARVTPK